MNKKKLYLLFGCCFVFLLSKAQLISETITLSGNKSIFISSSKEKSNKTTFTVLNERKSIKKKITVRGFKGLFDWSPEQISCGFLTEHRGRLYWQITDIERNKTLENIPLHSQLYTNISWSSNGQGLLFVSQKDNHYTIDLLNLHARKWEQYFSLDEPVGLIVWSPQGRAAFLELPKSKRILRLDFLSREKSFYELPVDNILDFAITSQGNILLTCLGDQDFLLKTDIAFKALSKYTLKKFSPLFLTQETADHQLIVLSSRLKFKQYIDLNGKYWVPIKDKQLDHIKAQLLKQKIEFTH